MHMVAVSSTMLPLGTEAPDFVLRAPDGSTHALADSAGAPALLVAFVCNHCPYVKHVAPALGRLAAGWQERGVAVVAINSNDTDAYPDDGPDQMTAFAVENGWTFPYLLDETQAVARAYRAACTPDFFLFDGGRRLVYRGRLDASRPRTDVPVTGVDLRAAIDAVLGGTAVDPDQHPSLGCNIKWRPGAEPEWSP
jgi:peroxiredoxin